MNRKVCVLTGSSHCVTVPQGSSPQAHGRNCACFLDPRAERGSCVALPVVMRMRVSISPTRTRQIILSERSHSSNIMKTLVVLVAALVLQLVSAKFEFTEEWELWKTVKS